MMLQAFGRKYMGEETEKIVEKWKTIYFLTAELVIPSV